MKAMKKVLALALALAMTVTAVPVTNAQAAAAKLKAGKTVSKSYYAGTKHALKLNGVKASKVSKTTWKSSDASIVKCIAGTKTKTSASIRCVAAGKATITAKVTLKTNATKTYKAKVTVKAISVDAKAVKNTLTVGESTTISATKVGPKNASLAYKSENDAIVTVSGGKVTAVGEGTANVIVELTSGNKVKRALVPFTVAAAEEGLTILGITDPISADYPTSVWVNQQAVVNVQFVRDGKPAAGESIIMTRRDNLSHGNPIGTNLNLNNPVAVTNANGIATFVIGYNDENIKATDDTKVGIYKYTVSAANSTLKADGEVSFAAIDLGSVRLQNKLEDWEGRPADIKKLVVSTNDSATHGAGIGYTTTKTASTLNHKNGTVIDGRNVDYVNSQQVSTAGTPDHQVAFDSYIPHIKLAKESQDLNGATRYQQDVNYSTGEYSVYKSDTKYVKLNVSPKELTYATLNFGKIQLSEHTRLEIATYKSEWGAQQQNGGQQVHAKTVITGPADMLTNGYQIPLDERYGDVVVRIDLISQGQVDTSKNGGYELKDVTGVYRTQPGGSYTSVALKDAKVEWDKTTVPMSEIKELTLAQSEQIAHTRNEYHGGAGAGYHNAADSLHLLKGWYDNGTGGTHQAGLYKRVTYQVPVFPYTGNAILTCYDDENNVKAYYVCPTVNRAVLNGATNDTKNENVLDIDRAEARYCYEVSYDEAFNQVGTVTQEADRVIVNSDKVGVTSLVGTVTLGGEELATLDATNDVLYTSVQWCPQSRVTNDKKEYALIGQTVAVTAQLVDVNDNPVNISGYDIAFNYTGGSFTVGGQCGKPLDSILTAGTQVTALSVQNTTDTKGQAHMVLLCSEEGYVPGVYATETSGRYRVVLSFKNGDMPTKADIYWLDADLRFTQSANAGGQAQTTKALTSVSTDDATTDGGLGGIGASLVKPYTGTTWDFGFETYSVSSYEWNGPAYVKVTGLGIGMSKDVTTEGTVSFPSNGVARASSNKAGATNIIGKLDSNSSVTDVTFWIGGWPSTKGIGDGAPALNKKMTLNVHWQQFGTAIAAVGANGMSAAVVSGAAIKTVYVKVTDKNGSPLVGKRVDFVINGNAGTQAALTGGTPVGTNGAWVNTDPNGIAMIDASWIGTVTASTVTAYINKGTADQKEVAQVVHWIQNASPFGIDLGKDTSDNTYVTSIKNGKIILTFKDNVVPSSVVKDMFTVTARGGQYEVTNVAVSGNQIALTVKNLPTDLAADEAVNVVVGKPAIDGVTYILTSDEGREIAALDIDVFDSTITAPVKN